jgi:hypothetical protein
MCEFNVLAVDVNVIIVTKGCARVSFGISERPAQGLPQCRQISEGFQITFEVE